MKILLTCINLFVIVSIANAQNKLSLFIDCSTYGCDHSYLREQLPIVDFVFDRQLADVHVMITSRTTGIGGQQFTMQFIGQKEFNQLSDTLVFIAPPNATQNSNREKVTSVLKAGLVPYLIKLGLAEQLSISFSKPDPDSLKQKKDPWNYWTFRIAVDAFFDGDKNYKYRRLGLNLSAARVTEKSRFETAVDVSESKNKYLISQNNQMSELVTHNDYFETRTMYVKSISHKWSWALQAVGRRSTFDNLHLTGSLAPGIEYNIFPYKLLTSKFLILRFMVKAESRIYMDETIYGKMKETVFSNHIETFASFSQPWGSISGGIGYYHFLHDLKKYNLSTHANIELRAFKGLSFNLFGFIGLVRDQLHLPNDQASPEEILLRLKSLSTNYSFFTGVQLSYRFGSNYNNIVNPRFTSGRF